MKTPHSPVISLEYVEVVYGRQLVLDLESLTIGAGERVAVIGTSGSGKTTLLRAIKGYVRPAAGKVEVLGANWATVPRRVRRRTGKRIGLIFQQFHLVGRMTVLENVLCGRLGRTRQWASLLGHFSPQDRAVAWQAICEVGLADCVHQRADTLSGGQQQRVAIARVVAQQPDLILADEPVSSLDPALADDVLSLLVEVQRHHGNTLVTVLHQPELARRYAERIIGLRAGRVVFDGPARALTTEIEEEIYRGREPIRFDPRRPALAAAHAPASA